VILVRAFRSWVAPTVLALLSAVTAGCESSPTSPSAPFSQTDVRVGTGATAVNGNVLTVHYTGWFYDASRPDHRGPQFESSVGGTPLMFTVGAGQVIAGWDRGVPGMNVGGLRRLVIPPSLAYGGSRNGPIPPNATLIFDIELLDVATGG
jgi:FKBP-type peptidyl-prolyl cis-trans isomerase FkpA